MLGVSGYSAKHARTACRAERREYIRTFFVFLTLAMLVVALGLAACSRGGGDSTGLSKRVVEIGEPVPKGGGRYKVGNPYKINGRWYRPKEDPSYDRSGIASWYGELFHGRYTANGEIFDMDALTAAHPTMPLPSYAQVTNLQNGRSIVVRVNDRGPYAHDRIIDLSKRSAHALGLFRAGTGKVRVRYAGKAPLNGDDSYERRILASQPWGRVASGYKPAHPGAMAFAGTPVREPDVAPQDRKPDSVMVASVAGASANGDETPPPEPATATVKDEPAPKPGIGSDPRNMVFVQAGSFRSESNAEQVRDRLREFGTVHVFPAEVAGDIWYRVRLGPYDGKDRASAALERVVANGVSGAALVSR